MQREDGSTFHKVSGLTWPGFDISPDTDKQDRYILVQLLLVQLCMVQV